MELDWKRIWLYIGGNNLEGTPSLCLAQNNVMLANNHSQCQYQLPCSSYSSGQNFLEEMWSDQGLFLVQKTYFILAEAVNRWCVAPYNTSSIWRSSPLSIIQASKSGLLLWLKNYLIWMQCRRKINSICKTLCVHEAFGSRYVITNNFDCMWKEALSENYFFSIYCAMKRLTPLTVGSLFEGVHPTFIVLFFY